MAGKALQRHGALRASCLHVGSRYVIMLSSLSYLSIHSSSLIFKMELSMHAYEKQTRVYKKQALYERTHSP